MRGSLMNFSLPASRAASKGHSIQEKTMLSSPDFQFNVLVTVRIHKVNAILVPSNFTTAIYPFDLWFDCVHNPHRLSNAEQGLALMFGEWLGKSRQTTPVYGHAQLHYPFRFNQPPSRAEARGQALFGPLAANFFALNLKILASIHFMQLRRVAFGIREPVPQARFHLLARRQ